LTRAGKPQHYLLWLALGTGLMALAMAVLLVLQLAQKRSIEQANELRADSSTALAFQFEREFLRLRQELGLALASNAPLNTEALGTRYDIFLSRMTLLRDNPSISIIAQREEYQTALKHLDSFVATADPVMASVPLNPKDLGELLKELNTMGPEIQALSLSATSEVSHLLEHQASTILDQSTQIIGLTVAQLVLLLVAAGALALRQRRQEQERAALEALTQELREANVRAEAANRGKSQFLATMSHELRTPFNGVLGMLGLLEATPVSPQQSDYIRTAKGSAEHLLALLNDILDVSALESGKMALRPEAVQLAAVLKDVEALMLPQALEKGLAFSLTIQAPLPAWVLADSTRLKQILFNLIHNAIKFTHAGSVQVAVGPSPQPDQPQGWVFVITDTGIGMGEQEMSRLFQRFYQVDSGVARKFGGTGLGLEISQNLACMMGGGIEVESTLGRGTVFTLQLPFTPCPAPVDTTPELATEQAPLIATPSAAALRVLVAEDHPVNRKLVGILLENMGCQTTFCENGQLALDAAARDDYDLVLMDVHMPVMDGLTATRHIRALPGPRAQVPIVVLTADVMNEAREHAMQAGVNEFVSKPVQAAQLQAAMRKCLGDRLPAQG
jgi:two-component system, sensor histidine kinase